MLYSFMGRLGELRKPPRFVKCETHSERSAVWEVQMKPSIYGSEYTPLCRECYERFVVKNKLDKKGWCECCIKYTELNQQNISGVRMRLCVDCNLRYAAEIAAEATAAAKKVEQVTVPFKIILPGEYIEIAGIFNTQFDYFTDFRQLHFSISRTIANGPRPLFLEVEYLDGQKVTHMSKEDMEMFVGDIYNPMVIGRATDIRSFSFHYYTYRLVYGFMETTVNYSSGYISV